MLTAAQFDRLPQRILALYADYEQSVIEDIARRLARLDYASPSAAWQMQRLTESGRLYESALSELAILTGKSQTELRSMFERAGVRSLAFDDGIYKAAGLDPLPLNLSPAMARLLEAGLEKTQGLMQNLTLTTASTAQTAFVEAADLAYMQVSSGATSYQQALRQGVKQVAGHGLTVIHYASGRRDQLDVAMRRAVLTGVNQTTSQLQWSRADELGQDLVLTSAHGGARPSHAVWQGQIFSRSGTSPEYPAFVQSTGYGTGAGLGGWNCVVGDTLVSGPAIRAAYRRKYSGEIIIIRTAGGHELTTTPNHPILTDKGWVAAGLLVKGDNVIGRTGFDGPSNARPNINQNEPRIENVFNSLAQCGDLVRLPASSGYFHGDISDGEIEAVFPKGFLGNSCDSSLFQYIEKGLLCHAPEPSGPFASSSAPNKVFLCPYHTPNCVMSGDSEGGASFGPSSLQSLAHSVRPTISCCNAEISEILSDQSLGYSDFCSDFILPKAGVIHGEKFVGGDVGLSPQIQLPVSGIGDTTSFDAVHNGMERATVFIGNELVLLTGEKQLDNIVLIKREYLASTHVYNLETEDGWYFANDIITHNCRHSFFPFFDGISENAYSEADRESAANKTVTYQGQKIGLYDATQAQRAIERKIRYWKREAGALRAAGLDDSLEAAKVGRWQAEMRKFTDQTGLQRQRSRERV